MKNKKNKGGRPALDPSDVKKHRLTIYLSDNDMKNLDRVRLGVVRYSPALSLNDFFRKVINNFDDTLIPYLLESPNSEVKKFMSSQLAYSNIFKDNL